MFATMTFTATKSCRNPFELFSFFSLYRNLVVPLQTHMLYITEKCPETKIRNDNSFHNIINLLCHKFSNLSILYILIELEENTVLNKITSSFITIVIYLFFADRCFACRCTLIPHCVRCPESVGKG